jgi:UDP-N-acetyl-D-glucosamine dehydrogenase
MSTVTVIGQGYVGLPLAQAAAGAGWKVFGLDVTQSLVDALNAGTSHVDDLSDQDIATMLDQGYCATTDPQAIGESDVVVICVPTPLSESGGPDLTAVRQSSATISAHLKNGTTVILESTTYPGTTEDVVIPILESQSGLKAGSDFDVAFSPERINPGDPVYGIKNTPKLVGGITDHATQSAVQFYGGFIDEVVPVSGPKEAETAKLLENTFRHVNIALVNEMSKFCHEMGIDIWEVIRGAATKPFGYMPFTPGPGVGGHCIPIDPNYLAYQVKNELGYPFRFVELAQEINNSMPEYVVERVARLLNDQERSVKGSKILLLGVTYKSDIADQRESPAVPVAELLLDRGARVRFHDPHVTSWHLKDQTLAVVPDLDSAIDEADVVVLLQAHKSYDLDGIVSRSRVFFDTRGKSKGVKL